MFVFKWFLVSAILYHMTHDVAISAFVGLLVVIIDMIFESDKVVVIQK